MRKILMVLEAVKTLSRVIEHKNEIVDTLKNMLEEQREFNKQIMDRLMSRDFQDYQINKPFELPELPVMPADADEDLAGDIVTDEDLK